MERNRVSRRTGEAPARRVYTVCDESRYLIVRNVPALNCLDELLRVVSTYGPIEAYRRLDEQREEFTESYWIKFSNIADARLAKRTLDDYKFFSNLLNVSYAPIYETLEDTKEKLEERRLAVLDRKAILQAKDLSKQAECSVQFPDEVQDPLLSAFVPACPVQKGNPVSLHSEPSTEEIQPQREFPQTVSYEMPIVYNPKPQHFEEFSMNQAVYNVRETLERVSEVAIPSAKDKKHGYDSGGLGGESSKRTKNDNRRRI